MNRFREVTVELLRKYAGNKDYALQLTWNGELFSCDIVRIGGGTTWMVKTKSKDPTVALEEGIELAQRHDAKGARKRVVRKK